MVDIYHGVRIECLMRHPTALQARYKDSRILNLDRPTCVHGLVMGP